MRRFLIPLFSLVAFAFVSAAQAGVAVHIDKSSQRMTVKVDGKHTYTWAVSTGRKGYGTPSGTYRPQWLSRDHYSTLYNNAPMPYSVFFSGNYAIHGTYETAKLGRPASHGCVRLAPGNAAKLFSLVQRYGKGAVTIRITN